MKLIIDIDEELYKAYKGRPPMLGDGGMDMIVRAVANGMPYKERSQGNWIDYSEDGFVECPFCEHATTCEDNIDELHYCWNCGAKMQKGGAE